MSEEKIYYDVFNRKVTNYYLTNSGYCTGNIVARKNNLKIITEHYKSYSKEPLCLDFSYTILELERGGKDFVNALRQNHFIENKFSPGYLDYIVVPKSFYNKIKYR